MPTKYDSSCTNRIFTKANDYDDMLRMLLKFNVPTVTVHKGNTRTILSFACNGTTAYTFEGNEIFDIEPMDFSFHEWVINKLFVHKGNEYTITIHCS